MEDIVYTLDDQRRRTDLQAREVAEVTPVRSRPLCLPRGHGGSDERQVADRAPGGRRRADPRVSGAEADGSDAGRPSSLDRPVPRLRRTVGSGGGTRGDAGFGTLRPERTPGGESVDPLRRGQPPGGVAARALAVRAHHPAHRPRPRRSGQHVRLLSGHDVHDGKLVWSCRLEEWRKFGQPLRAVPLQKPSPPPWLETRARPARRP
jgi:hypothetical protein